MSDHTRVTVLHIPDCTLCVSQGKMGVPALYDGKTTLGPWANMCQEHFEVFGVGLGLGRGQMLVKEGETPTARKTASPYDPRD